MPFDETKRQCGLLLDEWTETLPAEAETTGIAFHFDRPSSEPPQAWLLAIPPDPKGSWSWQDLVDSVTETLDLAHLRAVEPDQLDGTVWARFLPAIVSASTLRPITIGVDLGRVNGTLAERVARRWLSASTSRTFAPRSRSGCTRPSPSGTGSRAARAARTSRAACARRCATRCGCSRASGSSASSRATTRARPSPRSCTSPRASCAATGRARQRPARSPKTCPLDAVVERRRIPLSVGGAPLALDLRLAMGRRWLALVEPIGELRRRVPAAVRIEPPDPHDPADAAICAHPTAWAAVAAVAGRALDGGALYEHLASGSSNHAYDGVVGIDPNDHDALDQAADAFVAWFDDLILQPSADDAWQPDRLEYRFACSAPVAGGAEVLGADAFEGGPLDWHAVDVDPGADVPASGGGDPRRGRRAAGRCPGARDVQRDAECALLGVRGRSDELRRRVGVDDRPRDASLLRVRARVRQRLVPAAVRPAARLARARARPARDNRVRRGVLDRAGRLGRRSGVGSNASRCSPSTARTARARVRTAASCCCPRRRRSSPGRPAGAGRADPRRDGEHGVGRRASGAARRRQRRARRRGRTRNACRLPAAARGQRACHGHAAVSRRSATRR